MKNPICFALDGMRADEADCYVDLLEDYVGAFKVGLELFIRAKRLPRSSKPIILDLKLHDIPETISRAVAAGCDLGAKFMTIHIQQRRALEQAALVAAPYGCTLLGVTVLTSMDESDFRDLNFADSEPLFRVIRLARFASECGLKGFVCSPQEVGELHQRLPDSFFLVPGIRPIGSDIADQKRVGTPGQAVRDGASLIVVGRHIRDSKNPVSAAKAILEEVLQG